MLSLSDTFILIFFGSLSYTEITRQMHILFFLYNKCGFNIFISSVNSFKPALTVTSFANLIKIPFSEEDIIYPIAIIFCLIILLAPNFIILFLKSTSKVDENFSANFIVLPFWIISYNSSFTIDCRKDAKYFEVFSSKDNILHLTI